MAKSVSNFGDQVADSMKDRSESRRGFGYITLPDGVKLLKLKEDSDFANLDILPYVVSDQWNPDRSKEKDRAMPGGLWYRKSFAIHRHVGANDQTIVCPKRTLNEPCPICEYQAKLKKKGADKEKIKELYPTDRSLYAVNPLDVDKFDEGTIVVWDMANYLFEDVLFDEIKRNKSYGKFASLEEGFTLELKLKWKSLGKSVWPEIKNIEFKDREAYKESWLKKVPDLDNILKILSYEEIEEMFFENDSDERGGGLHETEADDKFERGSSERGSRRREEEPERNERPAREEKSERSERSSRRSDDDEERPQRGSRREENEGREEKPERGRKSDDDEERPQRGSKSSSKSSSYPECPHGHKFGVDTNQYPKHCDTCDIWNKCMDKKEGQ